MFLCVPLALVRLLSSFFFRQLGLQDWVSEFSWSLTATAFLAHAAKLWIWSHILLTPTITFKFDKPLPDIYVRGEKKILLLAWFHKHDRRWKVKLFSKEPCLNYFPLPVLSLMRRDIFALLSHSICFLSLIIWTLWARVLDKHWQGYLLLKSAKRLIPVEAQPSVPSMNPACSPKITAEMKHLLSLFFLCLSVSLGHFNYTTVSCIYIPEKSESREQDKLAPLFRSFQEFSGPIPIHPSSLPLSSTLRLAHSQSHAAHFRRRVMRAFLFFLLICAWQSCILTLCHCGCCAMSAELSYGDVHSETLWKTDKHPCGRFKSVFIFKPRP